MESQEVLISQLSNISHPLEGTFYLFLLALFFRWKWPRAWNRLLKRIQAEVEINIDQIKKENKNNSSQND